MLAMTISLASLTGPIVGGVLAQNSAWRWVFYIKFVSSSHSDSKMLTLDSLPLGAIAILLLLVAMPYDYGTAPPKPISALKPNMTLFRKLDVLGAFLLLAASLLLVSVLNETYQEFSWSSGTAIGLLTLCGVLWVAFFSWEWVISSRPEFEPIFPKHFFLNRAWMGMLM